jgi:hypothetical protein
MAKGEQGGVMSKMLLLGVFASAMAFFEAIVNVYLRRLMPLKSWQAEVTDYGSLVHFMERHHLLWTEQAREVAVIIMLIVVAYLAGSHAKQKAGAFLFTASIWNISYYIFLSMLIKWPPTLAAWDAHFMVPRPLMAPIYVSIIVSLALLMVSVILLKSSPGGGGKAKSAAKAPAKTK